MSRPKLLDLFSCAGGAGAGYQRAGFDVYAVDIEDQPDNPHPILIADALEVLRRLLDGEALPFFGPRPLAVEYLRLSDFSAAHASPPCPDYSQSKGLHGNDHPRLIEPVRELLDATGLPWIMENVIGAPLHDPLMLCGSMFGLTALDVDGVPLQLRRHRLFESNVFLMAPGSCSHRPGVRFASVYGSGGSNTLAYRDKSRGSAYLPQLRVMRDLMGIDWMPRAALAQSIPPAYTEYLGGQLHTWIDR